MAEPDVLKWQAFALDELARRRAASGRPYLEFLRVPTLSSGLYVLPAGGDDPQSPHDQDELYYVLKGAGRFEVDGEDGEDVEVRAGSVLFVGAGVEHRFCEIEEELVLLVFFSAARPPVGRGPSKK